MSLLEDQLTQVSLVVFITSYLDINNKLSAADLAVWSANSFQAILTHTGIQKNPTFLLRDSKVSNNNLILLINGGTVLKILIACRVLNKFVRMTEDSRFSHRFRKIPYLLRTAQRYTAWLKLSVNPSHTLIVTMDIY